MKIFIGADHQGYKLKEKIKNWLTTWKYQYEDLGADKLNNVILTPHIASATKETRSKMAQIAAKNIIIVLNGKNPPNLIKI